MKKVLIALIAVPVILLLLWMTFPVSSIQSIMERSVNGTDLVIEVKELRKGLFYTLYADHVILNRFGKELISLRDVHGRINPLSFIVLRIDVAVAGVIGSGEISGDIKLAKDRSYAKIFFREAKINEVQILQHAGIRGKGTLSGKFIMTGEYGHVEFGTKDASFEPADFSGIKVPLNLFNNVTGSVDIKGNVVDIVSFSLEGRDIFARLRGIIRDNVMDLSMELMPGKSLVENPLFLFEMGRYEVAPGYYVIPVQGNLPG